MKPDIRYAKVPNARTSIKKISVGDAIAYAAKQSGRGVIEIGKEYWRLSRGVGKLSVSEYISYRLFDSEVHTDGSRSRFLSDRLHWPLVQACNGDHWFATTEDKWLSAATMEKAGLPHPKTQAVVDTGTRYYGNDLKISTPEALRDYLTTDAVLPLFGKPLCGLDSGGSFMIVAANDDGITLHSGETLTYDEVFANIVKDVPFLLQNVIPNHALLRQYTPNTATVRMQNTITDSGVVTPFAILKIPAKANIADNSWRTGNIVCNLDLETGKILSAVSGELFDVTTYTEHPETGHPLIGETLPHWPKLLDVNARCAMLFQPVRFQSLDIALTPDGPIIVEINCGGSFRLPQLASRTGFLTDANKAFFKARGVTMFDT